MLQYHRNQENLECDSRQVVVQEKCFLHQEKGQVIHSPASSTDASRWHPELPGICRRQEMASQSRASHKAPLGHAHRGQSDLQGCHKCSSFAVASTTGTDTGRPEQQRWLKPTWQHSQGGGSGPAGQYDGLSQKQEHGVVLLGKFKYYLHKLAKFSCRMCLPSKLEQSWLINFGALKLLCNGWHLKGAIGNELIF